jgi:methylenetetrahydrofolate reductase (NADPH)
MKFTDLLERDSPVISFELFPPRYERGMAELEARLPKLVDLEPSFISVTYGAMGTTRETTLALASKIKNLYGQETAHHLTCVGSSRDEITGMLEDIRRNNIDNIIALRGDPPRGETGFTAARDGFGHANELVEHIQDFDGFGIAVAGYPEKHLEAPDFETDMQNLKRKMGAGADMVITQLFYDNSFYYDFVEQCRAIGIHKPVIPGLMPILNVNQIKRITNTCGSSIPEELLQQLEEAGDNEERVHEIGITHTANQALDLLKQGAPGIHFYILNRYFHIAEIMERIRQALGPRKAQ